MKCFPFGLYAVLSLIISNAAVAGLITDNNTYTTVNGTDWLDLSATDGMTVASALAANSGWTLATYTQYQSMFAEFVSSPDFLLGSNVSWTDNGSYLYQNAIDQNYQLNTFSQLFGLTRNAVISGGVWQSSFGFFADGNNQVLGGLTYTDITDGGTRSDSVTAYYNNSQVLTSDGGFGSSSNEIGSFLVRQSTTVPEPSAIALMGLGLLGFAATRRKHKKN